jgi:protein involved in polysaccharide export with SLBB domain
LVWRRSQAQAALYTLGPDDQIVIRVLDLEEFGAGSTAAAADKPYRIDLRGFLNLPLIGRVRAGENYRSV